MAQGKKSFILYCDQRGIFEKLSNEQAGQLIKHIFAYVSDENPEGDFVTELAFESIKTALKRDLKKWDTQQEQRSEAGKRSAEVRKRNAQLAKRDSTTVNDRSISSTDSVNVSVSDNVNDIDLLTPTPFDIFWKAYGKNVGLVPSQREWSKIDEGEYQKIIEHVPKFVKASGNFLKNPENYLKNRCWLDDLPDYSGTKEKETNTVTGSIRDLGLNPINRR